MPVYERGYTHWTRSAGPIDPPWWVIARRGLLTPLQKRGMLLLLFVAWVPAIVKGGIIYFKARAGELIDLAGGGNWTSIEPAGFLAYVESQRFFVYLFTALVGASLISRDRRDGGLSLYFSRPLTVRDYVVGKALIIIGWYLAVTLVPAWLLCVFAYLVEPAATGMQVLLLTPLRLLVFGAFCGAGISLVLLAFSCLGTRTIYVVVWWTVLFMGTEAVSGLFSLIGARSLQIINFAGNFHNAGTLLFGGSPRLDISPWWSLVVCVAWMTAALVILRRQIRPVEVVV